MHTDDVLAAQDTHWFIIYDMPGSEDMVIGIPFDGTHSMSDLRIGQAVRRILRDKRFFRAVGKASLLQNTLRNQIGPLDFDKIQEAITEIKDFEDIDTTINECIKLFEAWKLELEQQRKVREVRKAKTTLIRQYVQKNYDALFLVIGRRDGFPCRQCKALLDLEIDHIKPVSKDGTNDIDNLQLLCKSCNLKKHAKWQPCEE